MKKDLIKVKELAKRYPIWTDKTYLRKARNGEIPCTLIGKRYFFNPLEIKNFIDSITIKKGSHYVGANN